MFIHFEDKTEFQMKISDEGYFYIYCPKDKKLWGSVLTVIPTKPKAPESDRRVNVPFDVEVSAMARHPSRSGSGQQRISASASRSRDKITSLAKTAFPEAFK